MIQPGMMFGGEGPIMHGTWYNPHTGDAFTVRDSFFEDNQYTITTTDGRYLRYDQIQNYIQSDMKLEDLKNINNENKPKETKEALPLEVSNLIDDNLDINNNTYGDLIIPDDEIFNNFNMNNKVTSFGNINTPISESSNASNNTINDISVKSVNMNSAIIEKALKNTVKPNFSINVDWPNYPSKEIEMLKDIMEISSDEIVKWYLDNIQFTDFIMEFKTAIDNKIRFSNKSENIETEVIKLPEPEEVITIEAPNTVDSHKDNEGALAKEPKKFGGPKSIKAARKVTNKKK